MAEIRRPPSDIAPAEFFTSWLPQEYDRLRADSGTDANPPDGTMVVVLEGDGGGTWSLTMQGGDLSVAEGESSPIDLRITQSVDDWRLLVAQSEDAELLPSGASPVQVLMMGRAAGDALAEVKGALTFEVPGLAGRTWRTRVSFQDQAEPAANISIDSETLEAMKSGTLLPQQAFFAGKIQITGDQAFAMQVGMALMANMQQQ